MLFISCPAFLKTKKVKCPDGSEKEIYRHVDYIYPLENKEFKANFEVALKMAQQTDGKLGANYESVISNVFLTLDEANRNYIAECRHIYSIFQADPCKCHNWYAKESKELLRREYRLREKLIQLKGDISRINSHKDVIHERDILLDEFKAILDRYSESNTSEEIDTNLQDIKDLITNWQKNDTGALQ